jgi:cyclopropane fatty-acyl-phospholipid synthase-like methyltransferase
VLQEDPREASAIAALHADVSGIPDVARIRAYYDQTWMDYWLVWLSPRSRGLHFGYWDEGTSSHAESLLNTNRVLAQAIGIQPGQRILDAGCGVGDGAVWLARHFEVEVVGISLVPSQIARAQAFARKMGVARRVSFEVGDYTRTRFPGASFDVVWALESLCHAPDKRRFLAEAQRLLRPGGRLGMVEYMRADRPFAAADEALMQQWFAWWAIANLASAGEWEQWSREAGFVDVHGEDISLHVIPSFRRLYRIALLVYPGATALRALRLATAIQYDNKRGALAGYRALRKGLWRDGILTATAPRA